MTAQVIFLNLDYYPDNEEYDRLDEIQDDLYAANLAFRQNLRDKPPWEIEIRKEEAHKKARERLHLVPIK